MRSGDGGKLHLLTRQKLNPVLVECHDLPESPSSFFRVLQHGEGANWQLDPLVTSERIPDGIKDGVDDGSRLADTEGLLPQGRDQDAFPDAFCGHVS